MNILRLVAADKEKKNRPASEEFRKIQEAASTKVKGQAPIKYETKHLKEKLSSVEYSVTQLHGTER